MISTKRDIRYRVIHEVQSKIPAVNKGYTVKTRDKTRGSPNNNKSFGNPQILLFIPFEKKLNSEFYS